MTETMQRLQTEVEKSPKRVHFEELRPADNGTRRYQKSMTTKLRIKAGAQFASNQQSTNQFANKPLFPHNTSRDSSLNSQPKKSAMKTISPSIFSSPQQQQKSNGVEVKKSKKNGSKDEEVTKSKILTPSIFSAPQQSETDEEEESVVEQKPQAKNAKSKKQVNGKASPPVEEQKTSMITPVIFSAPQKPVEESEESEEEEVQQPKGKTLSKKNSSNAASPSTKHKSDKSPIREEPVEKEGITHDLLKKVAALKPLIDNATSNTSLKSDDSSKRKGEKSATSKKSSNDREAREDKSKVSKTGSNKSTSSAQSKNGKNVSDDLTDNIDSATAQIVLGPMRSSDPVHNALNFSAIQQQQKDTPVTSIAPAIKKSSSKKY